MTLLAVACSVMAGTREFSYPAEDSPVEWWGTKKSETYNVAVRIDNPSLEGLKIKGISVEIPAGAAIEDADGWLSTQLALEAGKRVADICENDGQVVDGVLTVLFDDPVAIGPEPVYAGYTFSVDVTGNDAEKQPVAAVMNVEMPGSFFVATSRSVRSWQDYSVSMRMASAMSVLIDVDSESPSVGIEIPAFTHALVSDEKTVQAEAVMVWPKSVETLEYQCRSGDVVETHTVEFDPPCQVALGHGLPFAVDMDSYGSLGSHEVDVAITKVNGMSNLNPRGAMSTTYQVVEAYPKKLPLFEDYTGLWCGYCPMGLAAMEYMSEKYGDDFVAVAYHNKDAMSVLEPEDYPSDVTEFPYLYVDRREGMNPFFCSDPVGFGTEAEWLEACREFTPVGLSLTARIDPDNKSMIKATCTADFAVATGKEYILEFILMADGLCNDGWRQSNHLSGDNIYAGVIPQLDTFIDGPDPFVGYVYNDVMVRSSVMNGDIISLGAPVMGDRISEEYEFSTAGILNLSGAEFLNDDCTFRVVALVLDKAGNCVNCVSAIAEDPEGIDNPVVMDGETDYRYYLLDGTQLDSMPEKGIYMRMSVGADGRVSAQKLLAR